MTNTPWIKLFALGAMVWMVFGASAVGLSLVIGFGFLFALLDASAGVEEGSGEKREDRKRQKPLMEDAGALIRQLFSRRVGPFYLALAVLTLAGWSERRGEGEMGRLGDGKGLAATRGWGAEAGSGHQPGKSGLCACGKPLGHDKAGAPPPITPEEAAKQAEAIQKRTMKPVPRSLPAANLPGIGPNAKPLPPGLKPNPNAKLPDSAQQLLDSQKVVEPPPPGK
jgi:hypothetical protein